MAQESIWGDPNLWKKDPKNEFFERAAYDKVPTALQEKIKKEDRFKLDEPLEGYKASVFYNEQYDMFSISRWKSGGDGKGRFPPRKVVVEAPNQIFIVDVAGANKLFFDQVNGKDAYWKVLETDFSTGRVLLARVQRMEF